MSVFTNLGSFRDWTYKNEVLPLEDHQIWSKQMSFKQFLTLWDSTFYVKLFKSFILGEGIFGKRFWWVRPPKDSQVQFKQLSHKQLPTLWVLTFMLSCSKVSFCAVFASRKTPKFGPNNCLTSVFLHYEFQLSMLSNSKSFILGRFTMYVEQFKSFTLEGLFFWGGFAPQEPLNLV